MIDYDKIKLAHELADEYYKLYGRLVGITLKLTELTQPDEPKPKYEIGQNVWFIDEVKDVCSAPVQQPRVNIDKIDYLFKDFLSIEEEYLYPSREALIDAQIEYWVNLKHPPIDSIECPREGIISLCEHNWIHSYNGLVKSCVKCSMVIKSTVSKKE